MRYRLHLTNVYNIENLRQVNQFGVVKFNKSKLTYNTI